MKIISLDSSKSYSIPDLYLNIGHLLDHFMMLIFAKAAFDAGREFGLSYEEIANVMACPVGTVRSRIFRAREAIDKVIQPLLEN